MKFDKYEIGNFFNGLGSFLGNSLVDLYVNVGASFLYQFSKRENDLDIQDEERVRAKKDYLLEGLEYDCELDLGNFSDDLSARMDDVLRRDGEVQKRMRLKELRDGLDFREKKTKYKGLERMMF